MTITPLQPRGVWLPLITPFADGRVDARSLHRLAAHYAAQPVDGLILCATAGEGLAVDADETEQIVDAVASELASAGADTSLFLCLSGSDTRAVARRMEDTAHWPLAGYLVNCPSYSRPTQEGLLRHFESIVLRTERPCMVYNIPYRSGVNIANETMLRLAALPNVVGVKDCAGDIDQSFELMARKPAGFSALTGEDRFFYTALVHGGDGGIMMTAHALAPWYAAIRARLEGGDQPGALALWHTIAHLPPLLFAEPSPAAIKHWLWRAGLIDSPQVRLPMLGATDGLAARIEAAMADLETVPAACA